MNFDQKIKAQIDEYVKELEYKLHAFKVLEDEINTLSHEQKEMGKAIELLRKKIRFLEDML
jgi:prefoldin subunit 5